MSPEPAPLRRETVQELVRLATLAPSGHNTQPWRFQADARRVTITPDFHRRLPVVDPDDHALFISLGAALENLVVAARKHGFLPTVELFPDDGPDGALRVRLDPLRPRPSPWQDALAKALEERQSSRGLYDGRPIPPGDRAALEEAARVPGVHLRFLPGEARLRVLDVVTEAARRQAADPGFRRELVSWIRTGAPQPDGHGDGLTTAALGMPALPLPAPAARWATGRLIRPASEARRAERQLRSSSAVAVFGADADDRTHWVQVGRAFERMALRATSLGIRHAHLNMACEVRELRAQLADAAGLGDAVPLLLVRLGYGEAMPRSPRRPLAEVLVDGAAEISS